MHDVPMHVRETEATALKLVGQAFVVDTEQVQNGGVEIVDMHFVIGDDVIREIIGLAEGRATFDAATRHPH